MTCTRDATLLLISLKPHCFDCLIALHVSLDNCVLEELRHISAVVKG